MVFTLMWSLYLWTNILSPLLVFVLIGDSHTRLPHNAKTTPVCLTKHRSHTSFLPHTDSHANHLMEGAEVIQEIPALVLKNLIDRSYEKRKAAAGEIESIVHQMHVESAVTTSEM